MAEVFAWSTADLEFELRDEAGGVPDGILDGVSEVVVTVSQGGTAIERRMSDDQVHVDEEEAVVTIHLGQADTGRLRGGTRQKPKVAACQVNIYYTDGQRTATYEAQVSVLRNLHPRRLP